MRKRNRKKQSQKQPKTGLLSIETIRQRIANANGKPIKPRKYQQSQIGFTLASELDKLI